MANKKFAITITRQFGSLGRQIARRMSEILDIEYYDRDIVERISREMNMSVSKVSSLEEHYKAATFFEMLFPLGLERRDMQHKIFDVQSNIINDIVDKESCIIVGRCSDYILRHHDNCISIYIYAPYEERLKNCVETLNMDEAEARKMIIDVDRARDNYHKHFTGLAPDNIRYNDMLVNSSLLGVEGTAQMLAEIVREKYMK